VADELPRLETDRLLLEVPRPNDAAALAAYCLENREHLAAWEPARDEAYFTPAHWTRELVAHEAAVRRGQALSFVLRLRTDPAGPIRGRCALTNIVRGPFQAAHLGFSLDRRAQGQGLMAEALVATIRHAFETIGLHRVMAAYVPGNERSARLLRRLGFRTEGFARDYLLLAGAWRDHVLTSLVNPDWRPEP
jgi:[ribosomal protein S5]-alanine N-acetyltransferase